MIPINRVAMIPITRVAMIPINRIAGGRRARAADLRKIKQTHMIYKINIIVKNTIE